MCLEWLSDNFRFYSCFSVSDFSIVLMLLIIDGSHYAVKSFTIKLDTNLIKKQNQDAKKYSPKNMQNPAILLLNKYPKELKERT